MRICTLCLFQYTLLLLRYNFANAYEGREVEPFVQIKDTIEFQSERWYRTNISSQTNKDLHVYVTTQGSGDPDR